MVCSSQLQQIGVSLTAYASDFKGWYPYRHGTDGDPASSDDTLSPSHWGSPGNYDRHDLIGPYIEGPETACPFSERDWRKQWNERPSSYDTEWVWAGYSEYAGYRGSRTPP